MKDQVFELENFRGPLDLLLHLIREQELEILEVDLSKLCDQYLMAIEVMKAVDINVAGEFLVMASTLVLIKSRAILPREEEIDLEEELDPGDELIQQLLEYRKYKTLSLELDRRAGDRAQRAPRGQRELPPDEENELAEIDLWDLVASYVRLMEELGLQRSFHTLTNEKPLRAFLDEVIGRFEQRKTWTLKDLILASDTPEEVFGVFLALLELCKEQRIQVVQDGQGTDIHVELREGGEEAHLALMDETPEPEDDESRGENDARDPELEADLGDGEVSEAGPALMGQDAEESVAPDEADPASAAQATEESDDDQAADGDVADQTNAAQDERSATSSR